MTTGHTSIEALIQNHLTALDNAKDPQLEIMIHFSTAGSSAVLDKTVVVSVECYQLQCS